MKNNNTISIAKAIAIILMVVGHAGSPLLFNKVVYSFRIPLFLFVSGYLFKEVYLSSPLKFAGNKVKGLYVPFVKWSLIFLLLHNILFSLNLYEVSYTFCDYATKIVKIFTMTGSEELLGGFWFLKELLFVSIIGYLVIWICAKNGNKYIYFVTLLCLIVAYVLSIVNFKIPMIDSSTILGCFMFLSGYVYSNSNLKEYGSKSIIAIIGFAVCVVVGLQVPDMGGMDVKGGAIFIYAPAALCGILAVLSLSKLIGDKSSIVSTMLIYIGNLTLCILIFHFIAMKLVSLFIIYLYDYDISRLSEFPVLVNVGGLWWILYSVVGVAVSILMWNVIKWVESKQNLWLVKLKK